jgi:head-tail adaptor
MSDYAFPRKDHKIQIYSEKKILWRNESKKGTYLKRVYLNQKDMPFWAYIRQNVAQTNDQSDATFPGNRYLIVINYRDGVKADDFVKWGDKVLKILSTDEFEGKKTELKLSCQEIDVEKDSGISEVYAKQTL